MFRVGNKYSTGISESPGGGAALIVQSKRSLVWVKTGERGGVLVQNQSESVKVQGRQRGGTVPIWCEQFFLGSVSSLSVCAAGAGQSRGGSEVKGHRAVEVTFFMPRRCASVEQPTGSRTGGTFRFSAE